MSEIRLATPADTAAIWAILEPIFRAGETYCVPRDVNQNDALEYWSGGSHQTFVFEKDGEILGTYFICPNQRGGGAHVCNCGFATSEAAQGKGVARQMLEHALAYAPSQGYKAMQFNFVIASNTRAVATWQSYGFDTIGTLPQAFEHPRLGYVDAHVMYKEL